jgi:hypothetical protein
MKREVRHIMNRKRFWPKRALIHTAFRLSEEERELWRAASMKVGVSLIQFVREAIKEKSATLLAKDSGQNVN